MIGRIRRGDPITQGCCAPCTGNRQRPLLEVELSGSEGEGATPRVGPEKGGPVDSGELYTPHISSPSDCRARARRNGAHGWAAYLRRLLFIPPSTLYTRLRKASPRAREPGSNGEAPPWTRRWPLISLGPTQPGLGPTNLHRDALWYRTIRSSSCVRRTAVRPGSPATPGSPGVGNLNWFSPTCSWKIEL